MLSSSAKLDRRDGVGSRERLLATFDSFMEEHHEGMAPTIGLLEVGKPKQKEVSDDAKLKSAEKGISLVADGISLSRAGKKDIGWYASNRLAELLYADLGEKLDREIENVITASTGNGENPLFALTDYIQERIESSILSADQQINSETQSLPDVHGSATTLSFTKLIELPDGKGGTIQRLFFANVGDSRISILRRGDNELYRLTDDDNNFQKYLNKGSITADELRLIDQAERPTDVPQRLRRYVNTKFAQELTNKVGHGDARTDVRFIDVRPGDRYIKYTDGLGQLTDEQIESVLMFHEGDNDAEEHLQREAFDMSSEGNAWRAAADDIAVSVNTVGDKGPSREYLKPEMEEERTVAELNGQIQDATQKAIAWRQEKIRVLRNIKDLGMNADRSELVPHLRALEGAKKNEAIFEIYAEQAELDLFEQKIPHKFSAGMSVEVWRDDLNPPGRDTKKWTVTAYEASSRMYTVRIRGKEPVQVSRYKLESWQYVIPSPQDVMAIKNQNQDWEDGWGVVSIKSDGMIMFAKEIGPQLFKFLDVSVKDANEAARHELFLAEKRRVRLRAAWDVYKDAKGKEQEYIDEGLLVDIIALKKDAEDRAQ